MRTLSKSAILIGILTLAAGGCSSGNSGLSSLTPPGAAATEKQHQRSWMLGEASSEDLLYIADPGLGGIAVYSYAPPKHKLVGILTGPSDTYTCVDSAQDVFATGENYVVEYKHGATSPARILGGLPGNPRGCAVDTTTGALAVPNARSPQTPVVSFFKKGRLKHTNISLPQSYTLGSYCAYDGSGNLFVGAFVAGPPPRFALLELPKNSKQFVEITLDRSFIDNVTGGIVWDGTYLDVADPQANLIYKFSINGQTGSTNGKIVLHRSFDIGGFFIEGKTLIVPALISPAAPSQQVPAMVSFYNYPQGGNKTSEIRGVSTPLTVVVSLGKP